MPLSLIVSRPSASSARMRILSSGSSPRSSGSPKRAVAQLVARVGRVADQLAQEDLALLVERVDDQIEHSADIGLERLHGLGHGGGEVLLVASYVLGCAGDLGMRSASVQRDAGGVLVLTSVGGGRIAWASPRYRAMTADEFLPWSDGTDARYELVAGAIVAMAPPASSMAIVVGMRTRPYAQRWKVALLSSRCRSRHSPRRGQSLQGRRSRQLRGPSGRKVMCLTHFSSSRFFPKPLGVTTSARSCSATSGYPRSVRSG